MQRSILHSDMNSFYASVECLFHPDIRNKPMAVGGDPELRHGIILAKNEIAKKYGVKTGEPLWQAQQKCPEIVFVPPRFERYLQFSKLANEIYQRYSDQVECFGLDEAWIDVTGSQKSGKEIAEEIRTTIKSELGITVSIGISYNKIFAKLGSDMKKPDATTEITEQNYKTKVWPLPVSELLYIGRATAHTLKKYALHTIGDLANTSPDTLRQWFGKNGSMLWQFANGLDRSVVSKSYDQPLIKSVGNSTTTPKDLTCQEDIKITLFVLAESVAARLRQYGLICNTVQIWIRDSNLHSIVRQTTLSEPTCVSNQIADSALRLFQRHVSSSFSIRSLGIRAFNLESSTNRQLSLLPESAKLQRLEAAETAIDGIRKKFGHAAIQRGIMLTDKRLSGINPKDDHLIHPISFLR